MDEIADACKTGLADVVTKLNGQFAIAVVDENRGSVTLAIDRMGTGSLSWSRRGSVIYFSTSAHSVAGYQNERPLVDHQKLYDYLFFHMVPAPGTVFAGVQKLLPANVTTITESATSSRAYWHPDFRHGRKSAQTEELRQELVLVLTEAVRCRYEPGVTGAFLSGGLDSSTVSGVLAQVSEGPARTFSIGFGVPEFDELEYARIAARHFSLDAHEYVVTPDDVVDAIDVVASTYDEPFGNSSAIPTYLCARFARENGIKRLLAGDGGDELFAGNERYAKQPVFERYRVLPPLLQSRLRDAIARVVTEENPIKVLRKLRSYVDQAMIPLPERFESWNFVYREGAQVMFEPDFMGSVDPAAPFRQMASLFEGCDSEDLLDKMLFYDWKFTLADNDLPKVTQMCAAAGVEVEFPMLDNAVVELSTRVPSAIKMKGRRLRSFYKEATTGFLPVEILNKTKHGFGLPFGVWLKSHKRLADVVFGALSDLKKRRIIRPDFIDGLIQDHRSGHPGYFGYVIWDLVILERWLTARGVDLTKR